MYHMAMPDIKAGGGAGMGGGVRAILPCAQKEKSQEYLVDTLIMISLFSALSSSFS